MCGRSGTLFFFSITRRLWVNGPCVLYNLPAFSVVYEVIALLRASYIRSFMANCCIRKCGKKKHWRHRVRRKHNTTRTHKSTRSCICILPRIELVAWDVQWFRRKSTPSTRWLRLSLSLPIYLHLYGCGHRKYVSSGVSSSLSGGGLAYGVLPSYTLHLGKRFMEHKSGGVASTTIFVLQRDGRKVVFI